MLLACLKNLFSIFYNATKTLDILLIMEHRIKAIISSFFILLIYLLNIYNPYLFADTTEKNNWHSKAHLNANHDTVWTIY